MFSLRGFNSQLNTPEASVVEALRFSWSKHITAPEEDNYLENGESVCFEGWYLAVMAFDSRF